MEKLIPSTYEKGKSLETEVADIYLQLGARDVQTNIKVSGQQLDVYVVLPTLDGFSTRVGIDCKNYDNNVGVNEVNKSAQKLALLRQAGMIDIPALVSSNGFTPEAKIAADSLGVKTVSLRQLIQKTADFSFYLEGAISKYEKTPFHQMELYTKLNCTSEDGRAQGFIDDFAYTWFDSGGTFLTLLGDYGTGKTTFSKRLFWHLAVEHLKDPIKNRIPIYIPLKRYRKEINIRSLVIDLLLHEYGVKIRDYSVFKSLNEKGRLFLILDAFDEMASNAEESEIILNFREIKSMLCANTKILLTCRTHFLKDQNQIHKMHEGTTLYKEIDTKSKQFTISYLLPFTSDDIITLVEKYSPDNAKNYLEVINTTYNLKELAKQPILLDMILNTVPEALKTSKYLSPSDLYQTYTRFWLDRDDWRTKMSHDQREFFMKELAYYFQANGITEIHFTNLPKYIRQKFPGLKTFRELDYFEADVRTCTFLVRDPLGNYSFVHRSFCEYFAALNAIQYILKNEWPEKLWKGKSHPPTSWITPETAQFTIEHLDKNTSFIELYACLQANPINGVLILVLLTIYIYSKNPLHKLFFDKIFFMDQNRSLGGIDFRNEITTLARKYHSTDWKMVDFKFSNIVKSKY
jgi:hypothetical protein